MAKRSSTVTFKSNEISEKEKRAVYRSKEFRSLDPNLRAQLILVREGAKSGAELDEESEDCSSREIDNILIDLKVTFSKARWKKRFCYRVSLDPSIVNVKPKNDRDQMFAVKFYGFPSCCARKYQTVYNRHTDAGNDGLTPAEVYDKELKALGYVPDPYLWIDFWPCRPLCPKAMSKGKRYKAILEKCDREAAKSWRQPATSVKADWAYPPIFISYDENG